MDVLYIVPLYFSIYSLSIKQINSVMPKFRKKPVVIEAIQWDGTAHSTLMISQFVGQELELKKNEEDNINNRFFLMIPTLESPHEASNGDWIIKGVKGEFYPCRPDIFEATYDLVPE
jgi:hypothetical protein